MAAETGARQPRRRNGRPRTGEKQSSLPEGPRATQPPAPWAWAPGLQAVREQKSLVFSQPRLWLVTAATGKERTRQRRCPGLAAVAVLAQGSSWDSPHASPRAPPESLTLARVLPLSPSAPHVCKAWLLRGESCAHRVRSSSVTPALQSPPAKPSPAQPRSSACGVGAAATMGTPQPGGPPRGGRGTHKALSHSPVPPSSRGQSPLGK